VSSGPTSTPTRTSLPPPLSTGPLSAAPVSAATSPLPMPPLSAPRLNETPPPVGAGLEQAAASARAQSVATGAAPSVREMGSVIGDLADGA
jgi:hypothetical protein